jgi:maltodextrin utilization protein YvdJ
MKNLFARYYYEAEIAPDVTRVYVIIKSLKKRAAYDSHDEAKTLLVESWLETSMLGERLVEKLCSLEKDSNMNLSLVGVSYGSGQVNSELKQRCFLKYVVLRQWYWPLGICILIALLAGVYLQAIVVSVAALLAYLTALSLAYLIYTFVYARYIINYEPFSVYALLVLVYIFVGSIADSFSWCVCYSQSRRLMANQPLQQAPTITVLNGATGAGSGKCSPTCSGGNRYFI